MRPATAAGAFLLALLGCDDPLVEPEEIVDLRVLGASAEVVSDRGRATPRRGEEVEVRVLAAGREGPPAATFGLVACRAAETTAGLPICLEEIARAQVGAPTDDAPAITFTIPANLGQERVSLIGVVCEGGAPLPSTSAEEARCSEGATRAASFFFDVVVAGEDAEENANPTLSAEGARLAGELWVDNPFDPCDPEADATYRVAAGSHHGVHLDTTGAAEELASGVRESLEIAHYVTAGDLERHFSVVEEGDDPVVVVGWKAPSSAPPGGKAMHFYAVVRDERGGSAWVHRALCVLE